MRHVTFWRWQKRHGDDALPAASSAGNSAEAFCAEAVFLGMVDEPTAFSFLEMASYLAVMNGLTSLLNTVTGRRNPGLYVKSARNRRARSPSEGAKSYAVARDA
jgi:hypothetical protein